MPVRGAIPFGNGVDLLSGSSISAVIRHQTLLAADAPHYERLEQHQPSDTRSKFIDLALYWFIWREETMREVVIIDGKPRRKQRHLNTRSASASPHTRLVAVTLIEAKAEDAPPTEGLEQAKRYARLLHVPFVFSATHLSSRFLHMPYQRIAADAHVSNS